MNDRQEAIQIRECRFVLQSNCSFRARGSFLADQHGALQEPDEAEKEEPEKEPEKKRRRHSTTSRKPFFASLTKFTLSRVLAKPHKRRTP